MAHIDPEADSDVIERAMRVAREFCGLELAYVSEFRDGLQWIRHHDGDTSGFSVPIDEPIPLEETYCQRVVDGRLPAVLPEMAADARTAQLPITRASGTVAYVGAPIRLPGGTLYGTLCCLSTSDAPPLSAAHRELVQLLAGLIGDHIGRGERAHATERAQNAFLATVSHDLRTPLRAVQFVAEDLATGETTLTPERAGRIIGEEVDTVLRMVDDVLLVARQRSGAAVIERAPVDLQDLARSAARSSALAAGDDGERIRCDLPAAPLRAVVDAARVTQALRNLLDNALKYSPGGDPVVLHLERDDTTAVFAVEDRGIGVTPDDADRLVERFFRGSRARELGVDGLGLGLATVQAIAEAHEGVLSASSEPGQGAVFRLRLPLEPPA